MKNQEESLLSRLAVLVSERACRGAIYNYLGNATRRIEMSMDQKRLLTPSFSPAFSGGKSSTCAA
jgi:hypothetical protein